VAEHPEILLGSPCTAVICRPHGFCTQAAEATAAQLTTELSVTRDELTRTGAVAARAAAADAKIVKAEGVVPAGETCRGRNQSE
jgi:hypothetical protein